ncbi:hypothetical protein [Streptomyces sp. 3214.6]|nr:hypothetical protein [Streptomyces sp. 3214.6]
MRSLFRLFRLFRDKKALFAVAAHRAAGTPAAPLREASYPTVRPPS